MAAPTVAAQMQGPDHFLELYGKLPRAGPGASACTRRAYGMMADLPASPRILDIGCGPGVQTVDLLQLSDGRVVALDLLPSMIERTRRRAERANVSARLEVLEQDMRQMVFPPASFDVIWSEGALYNLGFERGLGTIRPFLRPGGYVAVSEAVWLKPDPPPPLLEFWKQYPEIGSVARKLEVIRQAGYRPLGHFILPESAWTDDYYGPLERRIAQKSREWAGVPEATEVLAEASAEIGIFRAYASHFGYAFFVMRRPVE